MRRSVLVAAALLAALIGLTAVSAVQLDASSAATRRSALRRHAASLDAAALGSPESIDQLVALADNVLNAGVDHAAAVSMPTPAPEAAYPAPQLDAATAAAEAQNAAVTAAASEPSDQESDQVEFNNDGSDFDFSADMPHEEPAQTEAAAAPKPVRHRSQHRNAHVHHKARFQSGSTSSSSRAPPMPTTQQAPAVAVPAALNVSRASNASVPSNATGASNATRPSNATVPSNATRPANATGSNATVPSNATRPANGSTSGNATVILERPAAPKPAPKPNPYAYIDEQIRALDQEQAKWTSDTQRPSEVALRQAPGGLFALNLTTTTVADPSIRLNLPKEFILPNSTGVEAGGQAPAGSVLKTFNVIESQVLPTPYPSQQELTSGEPVKFETFVKSKGNRADTTRQAMGRPNREDTFPTPYDLFTRFDYDRKGELNYREFNDLIEYVHNDFRNPKARRMASYRVIIGTSQAVNISHDVYVTFLGPSGQRSREYLLNKGPFNASYVVLRVEAEDVWFVTRARLRLVYPDGVSPPANDTEAWTVRSFAVQLHGRLTQALQPFTVRQAKHIALRPGKLRLDDSPSAQALGGDVNDQWTQRHYQEYLKKTAEYKAWVEQHMQEQRVYNFGLYNNVTNPVVVNTTAAINGTVDSNSTASSNTTANGALTSL